MSKDTEFEWDEKKREEVLNRRQLDFVDAVELFDGRPVINSPSNQQGEARWKTTGRLKGEMFSVVWTYRGKKIRIITFRRAWTDEERKYNHSESC